MVTFPDARGEPVAAAGRDVVDALDRAIDAHLGARTDTRDRLAAVLATDPHCVLAHCLDGYLSMGASRGDGFHDARAALRRAEAAAADAPSGVAAREALHIAALADWTRGDMEAAARQWDAVLAEHPRDIMALRVSQFVLSYLGESVRMRDTVARVLPRWTANVAGYGFVLGCYAYGLEEAGDYARADDMGRRAVALDPTDIWAAHAVTHVAEMEGRLHDGVAWIAQLSDHWAPCNNFAQHLRWHEALFELELERYDRVLSLYDREVRRRPSDEYLDLTNAVSLLWRLEQAEVDVGARWVELAACAGSHARDHALVFADLHYLMAIVAVGDVAAIDQFVDSCRQFATSGSGTEAAVMADVGLPLAHAVRAHRRGAYGDAVDALLPVRGRFRRIGGSRAQRDLFDQLLINAAWRARRLDVASDLLAERLAGRPSNRWGLRLRDAVRRARGL